MDWCKCLQWTYFINTNIEQLAFNMADNFTGISRPKKNPKQTIKLWSESKNRDRKVSASVTIFRATPFFPEISGFAVWLPYSKGHIPKQKFGLEGVEATTNETKSVKNAIQWTTWRKNQELTTSRREKKIELERVPDPVRRPGPEEKLAINKPNTQYYPGSIFLKARWGSILKTWTKGFFYSVDLAISEPKGLNFSNPTWAQNPEPDEAWSPEMLGSHQL